MQVRRGMEDVNEMERINEARMSARTCADRPRPARSNWEIARVL